MNNRVLDISEVPELLNIKRSVFVIDTVAKEFWTIGFDAYPFLQGTLLTKSTADEMRYPAVFLCKVDGKFSVSQEPEWFPAVWDHHLNGIVESKPSGFCLPPWSRPAMMIQW